MIVTNSAVEDWALATIAIHEQVRGAGGNLEPMLELIIKATFWAIAPKGVTMDEFFQAWSEESGATRGATHGKEAAWVSMYDLFIAHMECALKLEFGKVREWPVERQVSETSKRIHEAPLITRRFPRGRDPEPFVPPCEENSHAVTVVFDYLNKKMQDERRGEMTAQDWQFLRSLDNFEPREMEYNPMTWAYLYGLWAHSMNVTQIPPCAR